MSLAQAAADARTILQDVNGFGSVISVTDPNGTSVVINGSWNDISQSIDPDTGLTVDGRQSSVTFAMAAFAEAGMDLPRGVSDSTELPWQVRVTDPQGTERLFKVASAKPDNTIGLIVCMLEALEG